MDNSKQRSSRLEYLRGDLDRPRRTVFLPAWWEPTKSRSVSRVAYVQCRDGLLAVAPWLTHLMWIIGKLAGDAGITFGQLMLAVLATFQPRIDVLHGIMIGFGMGF